MSESKKGTRMGLDNPMSKPVLCIELNKIWLCIADASKDVKMNQATIVRACQGKIKTANNCHWIYLHDFSIEKIKNVLLANNGDYLPVVCCETNKLYLKNNRCCERNGRSQFQY